jgi:hypothetical protein
LLFSQDERHLAEVGFQLREVSGGVRVERSMGFLEALSRCSGQHFRDRRLTDPQLAGDLALRPRAAVVINVPVFPPRLRANPPRQGFLEAAEYRATRSHLPLRIFWTSPTSLDGGGAKSPS